MAGALRVRRMAVGVGAGEGRGSRGGGPGRWMDAEVEASGCDAVMA